MKPIEEEIEEGEEEEPEPDPVLTLEEGAVIEELWVINQHRVNAFVEESQEGHRNVETEKRTKKRGCIFETQA